MATWPGTRAQVMSEQRKTQPAPRHHVRETAATTTPTELSFLDQIHMEQMGKLAHELRTPLTAILGFAQILRDPEQDHESALTPEQRSYVDRIMQGGRRLLRLTEQMLDMMRLENGQAHLYYSWLVPAHVVSEVIDQLSVLARTKDLRLMSEISPDAPEFSADADRLQQVLINLLSNAITYTPPGGTITIGAQPGPKATIEFFVRDTGPGIPRAYHQVIFQPFVQVGEADDHEKRRGEGAGLGLAISRQLVQLHRGKIWVRSARKKGSTFWVRLPIGDATCAREVY